MHTYFEKKPSRIFVSYKEETYNFPSHFHSSLEIAHCVEGKQNVKLGEKIYTLSKGDTLLISPNTVHEYLEYDGQYGGKTTVVAIICKDNLLMESVPEIITKTVKNPLVIGENLTEDVSLAFERIKEIEDDVEILGWTLNVIAYILRNTEFDVESRERELPSEIAAYVESNFKEDITIKHIANAFGYNPSYIAHIFCDQLKIPLRTYLGSIRSEYAASQIKTTNKSLTEIAYDAGFNSLNTFCRCFKKRFSKTPSQYRTEHKNKA